MPSDHADQIDAAVRGVLRDVLALSEERVAQFRDATPLFGALPELDSMAVAGVLTELEDRLGIVIEDDEVDGEMLETFGALVAFARRKRCHDRGRVIDHYDWAGGREQMLRFGPDDGPIAVVALPLFEEANRTRTFAVTLCRALAKQGVASALPDLAGQGESTVPLHTLSLLRISKSYEGAVDQFWTAGRPTYGVAIRSGALLDKLGLLHGRWHFAPQDGPDLLRELTRIKRASAGNTTRLGDLWYFDPSLPDDAPDPPVEIAGNNISTSLLTDLTVYSPWEKDDGGHVRTVRLETDPKNADRRVTGSPLWRRAEPDNDPALAALLAEDIAQWIETCGG